jgi:outer membrane biogenesis lipoprotein LolB
VKPALILKRKDNNMKKIKVITLLLMAILLTACGITTIVDTKRFAKVENIKYSTSKEYKYTAIAWQYNPKVKRYIVHTDSLYNIGDWIEIKWR